MRANVRGQLASEVIADDHHADRTSCGGIHDDRTSTNELATSVERLVGRRFGAGRDTCGEQVCRGTQVTARQHWRLRGHERRRLARHARERRPRRVPRVPA